MSIIIDMKSEQIKIINRFKAKDIQVFAFNPEDRSMIEKNLDDAPLNCLFYPNPFVPKGTMQEADLNNPALEKWLFEEVIPRCNYLLGRNGSKQF